MSTSLSSGRSSILVHDGTVVVHKGSLGISWDKGVTGGGGRDGYTVDHKTLVIL